MKTKQVIKHYGSIKETAEAIGTSYEAVRKWGVYPPKLRQYQIESLTDGKLKAKNNPK